MTPPMYAEGAELDHIAALLDVERLDDEDDDGLRSRILGATLAEYVPEPPSRAVNRRRRLVALRIAMLVISLGWAFALGGQCAARQMVERML